MSSASHWRVAKKPMPGQPGTLKLARKHGPALVCVRYRLDEQGHQRYTTVELVVDRVEVAHRTDRLVGVRVRCEDSELQTTVKERGARWDTLAKVWRMPYRLAAQAFMRRVAAIEIERCTHCKVGRWCVVEQRGADRAAIAAATMIACCRGPP